jgi:large subunit ribosomal protein L9
MGVPVLLTRDVPHLGKRGEIKTVPEGYARNFLVRRGLGILATSAVREKDRTEREQKELSRTTAQTHCKEEAKRLKTVTLSFTLKAGEKGELFGSVKAVDIEHALRAQGLVYGTPTLERPLKTAGMHTIAVTFSDGLQSAVAVEIKATPRF